MTLIDILRALVSMNLVLDAIAFYPQIKSLIKAKSVSKDVSIAAWSLWTYTSVIWMVYVCLEVPDIFVIIGAVKMFIGCGTVLGLAIHNQHFRFREN